MAANEIITPPAGAIGRGDAFVLRSRVGPMPTCCPTTRSRSSTPTTRGSSSRAASWAASRCPTWAGCSWARPVRGPASRRSVSEARKAIKATKATKRPKATKAAKAKKARRPPAAARDRSPGAEAAPCHEGPTGDGAATRRRRARPRTRRPSAPPATDTAEPATNRAAKDVSPYNEALPFIEFIADHPVGSEVEATVERFSSHGAYVLAGDARGYVPLRNLADPHPAQRREVLNLGERRRFVVIAIDALGLVSIWRSPGVVAVPQVGAPVEEQVVEALGMTETPAPAKATARKAKAAVAGRREAAATKKAPAKRAQPRKCAQEGRRPRRRRGQVPGQVPRQEGLPPTGTAKKAPTSKAAATKKAPPSKAAKKAKKPRRRQPRGRRPGEPRGNNARRTTKEADPLTVCAPVGLGLEHRPSLPRASLDSAVVRIATWNVNSLNGGTPGRIWAGWVQPDIVCLQETKVTDSAFPGARPSRARLRQRPPRAGPLERRGDRQPGRARRRRVGFGDGGPPTTRRGSCPPPARAVGVVGVRAQRSRGRARAVPPQAALAGAAAGTSRPRPTLSGAALASPCAATSTSPPRTSTCGTPRRCTAPPT